MIKFEHNNGDLQSAVFGGNLGEITADLCVEISLIYASFAKRDKNIAEEFRRNLFLAFVDKDIADKVFSTELLDGIEKSGSYEIGSVDVRNKEEFERQLWEILHEDK